jgi:hypothetical protein
VRRVAAPAVLAFVATLSAAVAQAQPLGGRVTVEGVAAANTTAAEPGDPMLIFDATATARVGHGLDVVVRPYAHRMPGGDWMAEMYQLQLRYEPPTPVRLRIDAGILSAQIGQSPLETLPDRNPTIDAPFFLYMPLPAFSPQRQRLVAISPGYPAGVMASVSGDRWDARAGVIDQTPARRRNALSGSRPPAAAQLVTGGGVVPWPGLRVGGGWARGEYDVARHLDASVANIEADFAIGYTRLAGEWIRDRFEDPEGPAIVHAFTGEAVRTLAPRWWVAGRASRVRAPMLRDGGRVRVTASSIEETVGYRLSPEITIKVAHQASTMYGVSGWDNEAAVSLVLARRWW